MKGALQMSASTQKDRDARPHRSTTVARALAAAAACALLGGAPVTASPLFDRTTSNVWVLDAGTGKTVGTFRVTDSLGTAWTESASLLTPTQVRIHYTDGGPASTSIGQLQLNQQGVLINQPPSSLPKPSNALPPLSLAGLDGVLSGASSTVPALAITPAPGTYDQTVQVRLHAIPGRGNASSNVTINWRVNGGAVQQDTPSKDPDLGFDHRIFLAQGTSGRTVNLQAWVVQGGISSAVQTVSYRLGGADVTRIDSDGDGVPDLAEVEVFDSNPLLDDTDKDSDGDGWSDLDEKLRGTDSDDILDMPALIGTDSDADGCADVIELILQQAGNPNADPLDPGLTPVPCDAGITTADSDGDGVSDFDEQLRGTDENDPFDRPGNRRLYEVEYLVAGGIFADPSETTPQSGIAELTIHDVYWDKLYDVDLIDNAAQQAAALGALNLGQLPVGLRVPAGNPLILRARHHTASVPDKWVVKAWLDGQPDPTPADIQGGWTTGAQWLDAWRNHLAGVLVQKRDTVALSPSSGLGVALMEAAIAYFGDLSPGAVILLGNDLAPAPDGAVGALRVALAGGDDSLETLHADYRSMLLPGNELAGFAGQVQGFYADPSSFEQSTTTRAAAALLQGTSADPAFAYLARLLVWFAFDSIQVLPPAQRAQFVDPRADVDGDNVPNEDELGRRYALATSLVEQDTDGDGYVDDFDPCSIEGGNLCLLRRHQTVDSDDDGIDDSIDNCMNVANPLQQDGNGDGIGDACVRFANIELPSSNVTLFAGDTVRFSSRVTELGAGKTLEYRWHFGGGADPSSAADPGEVMFTSPGDYLVELEVLDVATHSSLGKDMRRVRVLQSSVVVEPPVSQEVPLLPWWAMLALS
ncbi:MAG: hypothetical protein KDK91_27185, partial [Gammaproteobacteria bacterium]|nr:hypothetical protein [Gammaproteobacteria bacterium]